MKIAAALVLTAVIGSGVGVPRSACAADPPAASAPAPLAQAAPIPYRHDPGPAFGTALLRTAASLVLVASLALGIAVLARRYLPGVRGFSSDGQRRVQLLESRRITPRLTLLVVDFEGERVLLGQSGERVVRLGAHADTAGTPTHGA